MDIHEKDIGKETRVFLVTLPKHNIENIQICVGNGYESGENLRYTIYKVDKKSNKVSSAIGYYEFPKDKDDLFDEEKDFKVLDLGEEAINIVSKVEKKEGKEKEKKKGKEKEIYLPDEEYIMKDYFNGKYDLTDDEIIPTFLSNLVKPYTWVNDIVVGALASLVNVYVILVDDDILDNDPKRVAVYPLLIKDRYVPQPYVIISYQSRDHYQLIVDGDFKNNKFRLEELPKFLLDKMPKNHTQNVQGEPTAHIPKYEKIITTTNGDCYWDSVNRAVTNTNSYSTPTITKLRKSVSGFIASHQNEYSAQINDGIITAYHVHTTKDNDDIYKLVFPEPTVQNKTLFDNAFEALFLVKDKKSKQPLHDLRALKKDQQVTLITEYLKEQEQEKPVDSGLQLDVEDLEPGPVPAPVPAPVPTSAPELIPEPVPTSAPELIPEPEPAPEKVKLKVKKEKKPEEK
jgi:hypothetical protein